MASRLGEKLRGFLIFFYFQTTNIVNKETNKITDEFCFSI